MRKFLFRYLGGTDPDYDLTLACEGDIETVKQLLAEGADPNLREGEALRMAASCGEREIVELLIAAGADVNTKDKYHGTPLHSAAEVGCKEITELLIAAGADVNAKIQDSFSIETPLDSAIKSNNTEIADLLRKHGAKTGEEFKKATNTLIRAARNGDAEDAKNAIAAGADVNANNVKGQTPLDVAIERKRNETADLLRKHGGKTSDWLKAEELIYIAAEVGHIEAVKKHLADGKDVNAKGGLPPTNTALHAAALEGHKEIAELLIAKGADVNAKTYYRNTSLHFAVGSGHKEIAKLLIARGADVNAKMGRGRTPLDLAISRKHTEIADFIRKHGGKTGEELKAEGK